MLTQLQSSFPEPGKALGDIQCGNMHSTSSWNWPSSWGIARYHLMDLQEETSARTVIWNGAPLSYRPKPISPASNLFGSLALACG